LYAYQPVFLYDIVKHGFPNRSGGPQKNLQRAAARATEWIRTSFATKLRKVDNPIFSPIAVEVVNCQDSIAIGLAAHAATIICSLFDDRRDIIRFLSSMREVRRDQCATQENSKHDNTLAHRLLS